MSKNSQRTKKSGNSTTFSLLDALYMQFVAKLNLCETADIELGIKKMQIKTPAEKVRCSEARTLTEKEAKLFQVKTPAVIFMLSRGQIPRIAYLETYRDAQRKEHHALHIVDARGREAGITGNHLIDSKGADPRLALREHDLPERKDRPV